MPDISELHCLNPINASVLELGKIYLKFLKGFWVLWTISMNNIWQHRTFSSEITVQGNWQGLFVENIIIYMSNGFD